MYNFGIMYLKILNITVYLSFSFPFIILQVILKYMIKEQGWGWGCSSGEVPLVLSELQGSIPCTPA